MLVNISFITWIIALVNGLVIFFKSSGFDVSPPRADFTICDVIWQSRPQFSSPHFPTDSVVDRRLQYVLSLNNAEIVQHLHQVHLSMYLYYILLSKTYPGV